MCTYSFRRLIDYPTKIGRHCAALIDNIYCTNINSSNMMNRIFYTDISDHLPVFSINIHNYVVDKIII